jgi:hypothetical protein
LIRAAASTQPFDAFEDSMILPMFGLLMFLIVVGGLGTLVAVGDPHHARLAPYLGFVFLFAGLGALLLSVGLALFGQVVLRSEALSTSGFFGGYAFGGLAGAVLGFIRAVKRHPRIDAEARE